MPGKLIETLKFSQLFEPASRTTSGALYNGSATGATGIDTRDYDEAVIYLNLGTFTGTTTLDAALYANSTNDAATSTAISGADFTQVSTSNDQTQQVASLKTKGQSRYLFLRTNKAGSAAAVYGANIVLGKGDKNPPSNSEEFDL